MILSAEIYPRKGVAARGSVNGRGPQLAAGGIYQPGGTRPQKNKNKK